MRRPFFLFVGRVTQLRRRQQLTHFGQFGIQLFLQLTRGCNVFIKGTLQSYQLGLPLGNGCWKGRRHGAIVVLCAAANKLPASQKTVGCASSFPNFRYSSWVSPQIIGHTLVSQTAGYRRVVVLTAPPCVVVWKNREGPVVVVRLSFGKSCCCGASTGSLVGCLLGAGFRHCFDLPVCTLRAYTNTF